MDSLGIRSDLTVMIRRNEDWQVFKLRRKLLTGKVLATAGAYTSRHLWEKFELAVITSHSHVWLPPLFEGTGEVVLNRYVANCCRAASACEYPLCYLGFAAGITIADYCLSSCPQELASRAPVGLIQSLLCGRDRSAVISTGCPVQHSMDDCGRDSAVSFIR
jgi:hypothetical protein